MKIYLATPYFHKDPAIRQRRFEIINRIAAGLIAAGDIVFSPISHSHPIALAKALPLRFDYWEASDRAFIAWADELWVYKGTGWTESTGVWREVLIARELGKPVRYLEGEQDAA